MKALSTVAVITLVIFCLLAILPVISFGLTLLSAALMLAIWIAPAWIIATSDKTTGGEKIAWLLAMVFLSWFAWVFYFFLAPLKPRTRERFGFDRYDDRYFRDYD